MYLCDYSEQMKPNSMLVDMGAIRVLLGGGGFRYRFETAFSVLCEWSENSCNPSLMLYI
jgi:hypothetical protein